MKYTGDFETLAKSKLWTWRGWAIYSWAGCFELCLFHRKPKKDAYGYLFEKAIEGVSPFFLRDCGIQIDFDKREEAGRDFYYGEHSDGRGNHDPVQIELQLPAALLAQMGL